MIAANVTESTWFSYETEVDRNRILKSLLTKDKSGNSHWKRTDEIKLVPEHLEAHVKKNMSQIQV